MSGNQNVAGQTEVMQLNAASARERAEHQRVLLELEAKKRAFQVDVPTLPKDVTHALRSLGLPIRLFGENLANIRDRLRMALARQEILKEKGMSDDFQEGDEEDEDVFERAIKRARLQEQEEIKETKYTRALPELVKAREAFAAFSLERSQTRLQKEREYRIQWQRKRSKTTLVSSVDGEDEAMDDAGDTALVDRLDEACTIKFERLQRLGLEGSQYGDARPLSSMCVSSNPTNPLVATGSWSGTVKLWDGSSAELGLLGETTMAHEDRIMGIAMSPSVTNDQPLLLATASIDLTAKLWKVQKKETAVDAMEVDETSDVHPYEISEVAHLKGHAARLCRVAFHPLGSHVATTSFDHTWRLWDVETGSELLLQDGHWKEVFGIGFHPDGSLCSTTDFGSVIQCWDLRTGRSVLHFAGSHAKRILCAEFAPNGFQLATAGDDGTIKIFDLRKRKQFASIPAHSGLVTQLHWKDAEFIASSSFDGTAKLWSARMNNKLLSTLRGHEGKVMGVGILPGVSKSHVVTNGFDKTLKMWS